MATATVDRAKERAKAGEKILDAREVHGKPGTKQPAHKDFRASAEETVKRVTEIEKQFASEPKKSSAERSQEKGNPNKEKPEDRLPGEGPAVTQAADLAAGSLAAARTQITSQLESDARLMSDPRYESDQKILEMAKQGRLGHVVPSESELALRMGDVATAVEKTPTSAEEQAKDNMKRLEAADKAADKGREATKESSKAKAEATKKAATTAKKRSEK